MARRFFVGFVFLCIGLTATAATHQVEVRDNFFSPATLTIQTGDTVTWSNLGNMPHNVHADDGSFRCAQGCDGQGGSGTPSAAAWSFSLTFNDPGTIRYFCDLHGAPNGLGMAGSIIVEGSEPPPPPPPTPGETHVVIIPTAGSVAGGNNSFFQTSARVFNPSTTESIIIGAQFLVAGSNNANAASEVITIEPREVRVFNDVVGTLFSATGLGALRFHSDDPFEVTARVGSTSNCTSPQGGASGVLLTGQAASAALERGVMLHLEWTAANRSNIGFANPTTSTVSLTARLHGPDGEIGTPLSTQIPPRGAISSINLRDTFGLPNLNEENLYVTFVASQPLLAFGTLVDNVTNDPTFTPARPLN